MDLLACLCVGVCMCISNMELPLWARKSSESLVRVCYKHFAVTADKGPCVVHILDCFSLCVCVKHGLPAVGAQVQRMSRA
jgi:hypothetical protein